MYHLHQFDTYPSEYVLHLDNVGISPRRRYSITGHEYDSFANRDRNVVVQYHSSFQCRAHQWSPEIAHESTDSWLTCTSVASHHFRNL